MRNLALVFVLALFTLPGCFFSRSMVETPVEKAKLEQIVVGKSTKEDVARILGAPTDIIFDSREHDPLHVFAYEYTHNVTKSTGLTIILITFLNSDTKRDHVLIFFDEEGVVSGIGSSLDAKNTTYGFPFGD